MKARKTRRWLNKKRSHNTGWIATSINSSSYDLDCSATIADCYRSITLDFGIFMFEEGEKKKKAVKLGKNKLRKVIKELQELHDVYDDYFEDHLKKEKKSKKKKEKEKKNKAE